MTNYESIYKGATYLLDPNYQFTGYRVPLSELGGTTSIQTANQLDQVNKLLNQGMKTTEISTISPDVFEMIPKEHFKEIYRLNKLTGAESTLHAPTLDPSGFVENTFAEENRQIVQRQFEEVIKRSHELNPNGNIPVTIHASVIPGSELITEKNKETGKFELGRMIAVDQESGKLIPLDREKLYSPTEPEGKIYTPQDRLEMANHTKWVNDVRQLAFEKKNADEILAPAYANVAYITSKGGPKTKEDGEKYRPDFEKVQRAELFLDNITAQFRNVYEHAAKFGDDETKEKLKEISKEWQEKTKLMQEAYKEKNPFRVPIIKSNLIDDTINMLKDIPAPEVYKPIEDFAKDKASDTLSQVALTGYKQFGNTAPIVSIENPPYGSAIASGQDLKELIQKSREKFANQLISEGKSKSEANAAAEKLIGATWDTSHIAMMRKQGFKNQQLVEEAKTIAPYVKHVHFNDNFGSTHTDLPPGMGNVPIKDILEVLEKNKYKGKKIFEGGNFFQHFQKSPFPYTLSYSGSPLYEGGPQWNQMGYRGNYYMGQGPINPAIHHSVYGAGFTSLPVELGGEIPGQQSRFSGTPNQ